ncbi:kinase-like domain-containing protein [Rhizophagus irregularis DAOM 181602=DAOM 197198]|nr:kinase-like domain-containing protein [Rhizophagus irregularis DAOM 181602=DAOM 197198]
MNAQLKASSDNKIIEWIEYDKFEDVEYLAKGGFGTVFKAVWKDGPWKINRSGQLEREGETKVALKCLHNSQDITAEFLNEVESHILVRTDCSWLIQCFGITKDPKTENFIMIMELKEGSLRQHLNNNFISLDWKKKLFALQGLPPYYDIPHDEFLAMKICQGLRPKSNYKIPQLIVDIINQCWDADPLKRPNAVELRESIEKLYNDIDDNKVDSVIYRQVKEADEINKKASFPVQLPLSSTSMLSYVTHPQAVYTSRLLDFKNLPQPKNANNDDLEYSVSLSVDFTKLDINSKDENN